MTACEGRKLTEAEAIAIAVDHARSQGVASDGHLRCSLGRNEYFVSLKKPDSEIDPKDVERNRKWNDTPSVDPRAAMTVTVNHQSGEAETFYRL
jgi:hypothetical protein